MKIFRFCWGLELKEAVKGLATYGMVMSVIGVMVAAFLVGLPSLLRSKNINIEFSIYTGATLMFLVSFGWFVFSHTLYQKNKTEDITGVKNMIKIGSYIIESGQVFVFAISLIVGVVFIIFGLLAYGLTFTIIGGFFMIFPSLLLDGIRKKHSGKVKAWIISKFVMFGLSLSGCLFYSVQIWFFFLPIIGFTPAFMYSSGMVIVHYNILLHDTNVPKSAFDNLCKEKYIMENPKKITDGLEAYDEAYDKNVLESALDNSSKNGLNFDNQKKITDDPPPYSQIV